MFFENANLSAKKLQNVPIKYVPIKVVHAKKFGLEKGLGGKMRSIIHPCRWGD